MSDIVSLIVLGFVQGATEFLPISSTGHLILMREWLGVSGAFGLAEDAVLHLATAGAVLVYFRKDIATLFLGVVRAGREGVYTSEAKLVTALVAGTIPAVCAGLLFSEMIEGVFRSELVVALALIVGSCIFLVAEWFHSKRKATPRKEMTVTAGVIIGFFQSLALIPGMSRSGMSISGAMMLGFSREDAARFAFLLSFPVILGAGGLKLFELIQGGATSVGFPLMWGAVSAFVSGMIAIHWMLFFLRKYSLMPFVWYRLLLAGVIIFFVL